MSETTEFDPPLFELFVPGKPAPGGSKRAFINKHTGRATLVDDAKGNRDWKAFVRDKAETVWGDKPLLNQPLHVYALFLEPRPKSHWGAKGLKKNAPAYPAKKPDLTKLFRATEDALTGVVWRDDALIVTQKIRKRYIQFEEKQGVYITIMPATGPT